jgi:hypothetical protein
MVLSSEQNEQDYQSHGLKTYCDPNKEIDFSQERTCSRENRHILENINLPQEITTFGPQGQSGIHSNQ